MRDLTTSESQFVSGSLPSPHISLEDAIKLGSLIGLMLAPGAIALIGYEFYIGTFTMASIANAGGLMVLGGAIASAELYMFLN